VILTATVPAPAAVGAGELRPRCWAGAVRGAEPGAAARTAAGAAWAPVHTAAVAGWAADHTVLVREGAVAGRTAAVAGWGSARRAAVAAAGVVEAPVCGGGHVNGKSDLHLTLKTEVMNTYVDVKKFLFLIETGTKHLEEGRI
jgi:hypothetical protein